MKTLFRTLAAFILLASPVSAQRILELTNQGQLRHFEARANGVEKINLQAPAALAADYTLTWPIDDGAVSTFLMSDGAGILSWSTAAASLQAAYDGGKTIAVGATPIAITIAGDNEGASIVKAGTGAGIALRLESAGTAESLRINHSGAGTAFGLVMTGNATAVSFQNDVGINQAVLALRGRGTSAALQVTQDNLLDAITTDGDIRAQQLISTMNIALSNANGLKWRQAVGNTYYTALTLDAADDLFLGNTTQDWPVTIQTGATQAINFRTNGSTRYSLSSTGELSSTQASNNPMLGLNKTGAGAGTVLVVDNDGTGIGVSIIQDGAENGLRLVQNGSATAASITQVAGGERGLFVNKTGAAGNPAAEIDNDGTGEGLLVTQDGVGVAVGIDQDANAVALRLDTSTGSSHVIDITNAGTGKDVDGTSSTWSVTKTGDGAFNSMAYPPGAELTVATGAITVVASVFQIDTEADAATDDLDTMNTSLPSGTVVIIRASNSARTVVVTEAGNMALNGGSFSMDNIEDTMMLIFIGTVWYELTRSSNGA